MLVLAALVSVLVLVRDAVVSVALFRALALVFS